MPTTPPAAVEAEFQRAFEHHRAGRIAEAAAIYERIVTVAPAHADALHLLGSIKAQTGHPAEGERLIAAALRVKSDMPLMWSNHGNALALLDRREEAIASYDRAIALAPGFVEARYNRCNHLVALRRAPEALADMERALAVMPGNHILETGRANALLALDRSREALAAYEAAIAASPRNLDALGGRGQALLATGRPLDALAAFEQVLTMVSGHLELDHRQGPRANHARSSRRGFGDDGPRRDDRAAPWFGALRPRSRSARSAAHPGGARKLQDGRRATAGHDRGRLQPRRRLAISWTVRRGDAGVRARAGTRAGTCPWCDRPRHGGRLLLRVGR